MLNEVRRNEAAPVHGPFELELLEEAKEPERALLASTRVEHADDRLLVALGRLTRIDAWGGFEGVTLFRRRPHVVPALVSRRRVRADEIARAEVGELAREQER